MKTVPILYFSDILCVWAYIAQPRLDEAEAQFGRQIDIQARFCPVFGDTARKMASSSSETPLAALWRHLRAQVMVYGPNLDPMYFRYYDPRVLRSFLPTCTPRQLAEFFGPVGFFIAEDEEPVRAHAWSLADGQLVAQVVGP